MNKKIKLILIFLLMLLGVFFFIYGGYDDSPGAQGLGLAVVIFSVFILWKRLRRV